MNRRNFLGLAASSTTGLMFPVPGLFTTPQSISNMDTNFQLKILATNWGFAGSLDEYCAKVKKEGYDGIEIWWPLEQKGQDELFSSLKKYQLEVGFLCGSGQSYFKEHLEAFKKMIDAAATNKIQKPLYINCHSGRDYFSFEENLAFINHTTQLSKSSGIQIYHETHRSRILYSAPAARKYFDQVPELRITFDVSHWCNVSESLLHDQQSTIDLALQRTDHIHARIGHPEGPQVNDPRAPEWEDAVKVHVAWWDKVVEMKKQKGEVMTFLTEFGPMDYMPTLPYTRQPLANQWEINVYMMKLLRSRYGSND